MRPNCRPLRFGFRSLRRCRPIAAAYANGHKAQRLCLWAPIRRCKRQPTSQSGYTAIPAYPIAGRLVERGGCSVCLSRQCSKVNPNAAYAPVP